MAIRSSALIAGVIGAVLVVIGIVMLIQGWPMQTPAQNLLMDLAQVPMSLAVAVAIGQMWWERRRRLRTLKSFFAVIGPAVGLVVAGAITMIVGLAVPIPSVTGPGQMLIWVGLALAFCYLAVDSIRRDRHVETQLLADEDDGDRLDEWEEWPDDSEDVASWEEELDQASPGDDR